MPIKLVSLNLNRHDTRQQPAPAYRPASRANQKAASKRTYQCTYTFQQCLYISWNVCSHLYTEHGLHNTQYTSSTDLYIVCTCLYNSKHVQNCMNMYVHVWTMYIHVYTSECTYHVRTMYIRVCTFAEMYIRVCTCLWFSLLVYTMSVSRCQQALYIGCIYIRETCMYTFIPCGQDSRWVF